MKAYIVETGREIEPFGVNVKKIYSPLINFGNLLKEELSLSDLKVRNIKSFVEIDSKEAFLLIPDYVFVTSPLIKRFLFLCKNSPDRSQRLSVIRSKLTEYYTALMDIDENEIDGEHILSFDIFYLPQKRDHFFEESIDKTIKRLRAEAAPTRVSQNFGIKLQRLSNVKGKVWFEEFPVTEDIIGHQRFWFHSLFMNIIYLNAFRDRLSSGIFKPTTMKKRKMINDGRIVNSIIGSNVWIHPTAIIEDSVIAENVRIGAKTIIRNSVIMGGSTIGDSNIIINSLLGEDVTSLSNSLFRCSVVSPKSTVSNIGFCYSMLGEGVFLTTAVIFLYEGIDSTIKIKYKGEELDTGRYFLGSAAGNGSVLGTRAIVSPGISLPSNTIIVLRPEEGVMKIPALNESDYYVWDNATIKRFDDIFPDFDKNDFI